MNQAQKVEYAAQWGSAMTGGDPGACAYGFSPKTGLVPQSEEHREGCLAWFRGCLARVVARPWDYAPDDPAKLREIIASLEDQNLDPFFRAYVECALWSSLDDDGEPLVGEARAIDPESLATMRADCEAFQTAHAADLDQGTPAQGGHDLWLTRNGYGTGFWDREDLRGKEQAARLTDAAHALGGCTLYVGDDGLIYLD